MSENQISRKIGNSSKNLPDFEIEKLFWDKGFVVVGVDEVGKGAVAGAVVACAAATKCLMTNDECLINVQKFGINDSKRLSRNKREELEPIIKKYFYWGIGEAGVEVVNKKGIVYATRLAMKRAIRKNLKSQNSKLKTTSQNLKLIILIDGRRIRGIGHQREIIKGDQKSISIAAASILAKVYRDKLMRVLAKKYLNYGFERHVGYGTEFHAKMIKELGVCEIHRVGFVRSLLKIQ